MAANFDPYYTWLGIPPEDQPADHYRLLGLKTFEANADAISHAADKQMAHLRTLQSGKHGAASQQLLNEISAAGACLLNAERKQAYDQGLREKLAAKAKAAQPAANRPLPVAAPLPQRPVAMLPPMPGPAPVPLPAPLPGYSAAPALTRPAARNTSNNLALALVGGGVLLLVAALGIVAFVLSQANTTVAVGPKENQPSTPAANVPPPPPPVVPTSPPPPPSDNRTRCAPRRDIANAACVRRAARFAAASHSARSTAARFSGTRRHPCLAIRPRKPHRLCRCQPALGPESALHDGSVGPF